MTGPLLFVTFDRISVAYANVVMPPVGAVIQGRVAKGGGDRQTERQGHNG